MSEPTRPFGQKFSVVFKICSPLQVGRPRGSHTIRSVHLPDTQRCQLTCLKSLAAFCRVLLSSPEGNQPSSCNSLATWTSSFCRVHSSVLKTYPVVPNRCWIIHCCARSSQWIIHFCVCLFPPSKDGLLSWKSHAAWIVLVVCVLVNIANGGHWILLLCAFSAACQNGEF